MNTTVQNQNQNRTAPWGDQDNRGFVMPPANVSATENEYIVQVEMPGVNKDGLEITVESNELTITGRRHAELPDGELCYCESSTADFRRVFEIGPDVDTSKINAKLEQGVLTLRLPRSEKAKPKKIDVQVA